MGLMTAEKKPFSSHHASHHLQQPNADLTFGAQGRAIVRSQGRAQTG